MPSPKATYAIFAQEGMAEKSIVRNKLVIEFYLTMVVLERVRGLRLRSVAGFLVVAEHLITNRIVRGILDEPTQA